jgi:hypothetical protein
MHFLNFVIKQNAAVLRLTWELSPTEILISVLDVEDKKRGSNPHGLG